MTTTQEGGPVRPGAAPPTTLPTALEGPMSPTPTNPMTRLRSAAQRALESLDDLIANTTDPGVEALGARCELARELSNTSPEVLGTLTTNTEPAAAPTDRRARYAAAIRDNDGWVLDDGQHMLDAVMGVADGEQAELRATVLNEAADEVEADARARHNRSYSDNRIFEWKGARAAAARLRRLAAEAQQPTEIERTLGHADDGKWHDVTGQTEPTLTPSQFVSGLLHTLNSPSDEEEPKPEAQQPTPDVAEETKPCGKTIAVGGKTHQPCNRSAGHPEAYCRDASSQDYFLAAEETK